MGDINIIDTLKKNKSAKDYQKLLHSEGFTPLIHEATRITEIYHNCIDHIFCKFASSTTSGSIAAEIAEHLPVFTVSYDPKFQEKIEIRDFHKFNNKLFKDDLATQYWSNVYTSKNVNECFHRFLHIF